MQLRQALRSPVALLSLTLLLTACGKDAEIKSASTAPSTANPAKPSDEPTPIDVPFEERLNALEVHPEKCQAPQISKLGKIAEELRALYLTQLADAKQLDAAKNVHASLAPYFTRVQALAQGCKQGGFENLTPEETVAARFVTAKDNSCENLDTDGALLAWKILRLGDATRGALGKQLSACGLTDTAANESRFRKHPLGALHLQGQAAGANACSLDSRYFAEEAGAKLAESYQAVAKPRAEARLLALQLHLSLALSFRKLGQACEQEQVKEPALALHALETELSNFEARQDRCSRDGDLAGFRKRATDSEPADLEKLLSGKFKQTVKDRYQALLTKLSLLEAGCQSQRESNFNQAQAHGIKAKWAEFVAQENYTEARLAAALKLQAEVANAKAADQKLPLTPAGRKQLEALYQELNASIGQWLSACRASIAADKKKLEEEKKREEERKRLEEEKRTKEEAEKKRAEDEKRKKDEAERKKLEEEKRAKEEAEKKRLEEEKRKEAERKRLEEEKRKKEEADKKRAEEEQKRLEEQKRAKEEADKKRAEEEKKKEEERKRLEEQKRQKEEAEKKRLEEEKRKKEEADKKRAEEEQKRLEEQKRAKEEADRKRLEEEKRKKEEADRKKAEEQKRKEEQRKRAEEEQRQREEEQKKIDQEKKRLEEERKKAEGEKYKDTEAKRQKLTPPLWEKRNVPGAKAWTAAVLSVLRPRMSVFDRARDADYFCPGYHKAALHERENCWLQLISAVSQHESNFKTSDSFGEPNGVDSIGLLALSAGECPNAPTAKSLGNPIENLKCGVNRMAMLLTKDPVIDGSKFVNGKEVGRATGLTAYWSTLKPPHQRWHPQRKFWMKLGKKGEVLPHTRKYKDLAR